MTDEEPRVDRELAFDPVEILAEGPPVVAHARFERLDGHAFDAGEHAGEVGRVLRLDRRDGEAAVAADHGGDAVERRGSGGRVPQHLRVVVGVDVDETGRDDAAVGVDGLFRFLVDVADSDDPPGSDPDVGALRGCARAVDERATLHHEVEHARTSSVIVRLCRSAGRRRLPPSVRTPRETATARASTR